MPRVAQASRHDTTTRLIPGASQAAGPYRSPMKIPLNDDAQEKAQRLEKRHVLQDIQMNQIKAAASPMRKLSNFQRANSSSPASVSRTPRRASGKENALDGADLMVSGIAVSPMKRAPPLLANFEEWMKMATDNKINATNSWNFALIDYFHDMSLLKEGDGVNFQKASCTLDGCVKIYTSRVDSVATETGKLLSGLADSRENTKKNKAEGEGAGDSDEEVEDEDGVVRKKPKRKTQRSSEATLATSFAALQLKKFELEFSVDPLFKKASADFDEGGAKGLLLNHLAIDKDGRIVFDSSDDAGDAADNKTSFKRRRLDRAADKDEEEEEEELENDPYADSIVESASSDHDDVEVDIGSLGIKFFPDLTLLDEQDICPSLKTFDLSDPASASAIPFLKAPDDWRQERDKDIAGEGEANTLGRKYDETGMFIDEDNPAGFDDDDGLLDNFAIPEDAAFGEGGEAWARDAAIEPRLRVHSIETDNIADGEGEDGAGVFEPDRGDYAISMVKSAPHGAHDDILSYFDEALKKNWAGPEHWRIRKVKDISKPPADAKPRKEKEVFEIDFSGALSSHQSDLIYTQATSNSAISMPKKDWKSKSRNLLPDDRHFNSKQLLTLFIKPRARMGDRRVEFGRKGQSLAMAFKDLPDGEIDEAYWANKQAPSAENKALESAERHGDYDANFFQDDGLDMGAGAGMDDVSAMEFADAREQFSPGLEGAELGGQIQGMDGVIAEAGVFGSQNTQGEEGAFGTQLVTQSRRLRPEYVQYARVAKKVDVRRLKEELWKGMGLEPSLPPTTPSHASLPAAPPAQKSADGSGLKFTSVMQGLQGVYPAPAMADISTSYCFICLLHLANEKGLVIKKQEGLRELDIWRDESADLSVGA